MGAPVKGVVDEEYLKGRMEGLYRLVTVLNEVVDTSDENNKVLKSLAEHILEEMMEIMRMLGEEVQRKVKPKIEKAKKASSPVEKVTASYDVLSELMKTG